MSAEDCVSSTCASFSWLLPPDMFTYWILPVMGNVDDPRDLKTVEKDLAKSSDQKEAAYTDINKLNNEQKDLNDKISRTKTHDFMFIHESPCTARTRYIALCLYVECSKRRMKNHA